MRIITFCGFLALAAIFSIGREVVNTASTIVGVAYQAFNFIGDLCLDVLRADYGNSARIDRWIVTQFRVIGLLKPEYDDALETDGQNFMSRVRLASHC